MPIISDPIQTRELLDEVRQTGAALPAFCAEDERTQEAILAGTLTKAKETGVDDLPVIVACTVNYPARGQMNLYTRCGDYKLGLHAFFNYLDVLSSEHSPYKNLRILPCLDHGIPELDEYALNGYADQFAMVMFDASEHPFDENIRMTAEYVERMKDRVVIEGCVDEIVEAGKAAGSEITTVSDAERYVRETGVDLIVANLGTEHRASDSEKRYHSKRAREISEAVGKILCLHGTSCLKEEEVPKLPGDGILKINIYTILARLGGQAVARNVLDNMGNMFSEDQIQEFINAGVLGKQYTSDVYVISDCQGKMSAKLACVAEPPRRDAWVDAVAERVKAYLDVFGYEKL